MEWKGMRSGRLYTSCYVLSCGRGPKLTNDELSNYVNSRTNLK